MSNYHYGQTHLTVKPPIDPATLVAILRKDNTRLQDELDKANAEIQRLKS